jgi:uncharacterized protein (DUF885 family)
MGDSFGKLRDSYVKAFLTRFPVVATYLGADGLDPAFAALNGKLHDYSPTALLAEKDEWMSFSSRLAKIDRRKLSPSERIDADVMEAQLAFLLHNLERRVHEKALDVLVEEPFRGVEWLMQGMAPNGDGFGTKGDWSAVAARLNAVPAYLKTALANVRRGSSGASIPDRRLIRAAVDASAATAESLEKDFPAKATAWMAPLPDEARGPVLASAAAATKAFREFRQGLLELYFDASGKALKPEFDRDRFAAGEAEYSWALKNNLRVTKTPRELHAWGKTKVAGTLGEMTVLARAIAREKGLADDSLPGVFNALSNDVPKSDFEMLEWYRDACARLVEYGRKSGLFDIPAEYKLNVVFTPPPLRDTIEAAYYPAPPFRKTGVGVFYVTPTGDDAAKLREHARAAVASLAAHEGFPGHDWYYRLMSAKGAVLSPLRWLLPGGVEDSASMWADSMSSEGWALYSEQLVGEKREGFPEGFYTREERFFQLQNQLLRDVRVVVDTGIHCGTMTFDDAVTYFAKNATFVKGRVSTDPAVNPDVTERASVELAKKALFRYSKWPTQAITYRLGKAEILELRKTCQEIEGVFFVERRFHEELLSEGPIPPAFSRESIRAMALKRFEESMAVPGATSIGIK